MCLSLSWETAPLEFSWKQVLHIITLDFILVPLSWPPPPSYNFFSSSRYVGLIDAVKAHIEPKLLSVFIKLPKGLYLLIFPVPCQGENQADCWSSVNEKTLYKNRRGGLSPSLATLLCKSSILRGRRCGVNIFTMEYYSDIKRNEIMPFAATWMELEIIILSEVSQKERKTNTIRHCLYVESKMWRQLIYKMETNSQT